MQQSQIKRQVEYAQLNVNAKIHFERSTATKVKRELIIRENQPAELPDGVVRSTTGYDLGLDNIQTADVKTRFQMFEKISTKKEAPEELQRNVGMKRSAAVLSKMKKIRAKGIDVGDAYKQQAKLKDSVEDDDDSIHSEDYEDDEDVDLIRAKRAQRERPLIIDNMNEIKTKFEAGIEQSREARHLERKMEIQNIRSKLFWGKQARTKEMYESAVAELEINPKLRNKGLLTAYELDNVKAAANKKQTIQQRFETGDAFKKSINDDDDEVNGDDSRIKQQQELESKALISNKVSERMQMLAKQQAKDQMIKSHLKVKNVEKADILNQFEFFENYNPDEHIRKDFKITPTESSVQQKNSAHDENNETLEKNGIKIDGMKIDGLKIDGVVEKAKNTYLHSLKKNETLKIRPSVLNSRNANQLNDKKVEPTKTIQSESQPHPNEESESEAESEISSRKPSYLDEDLKFARAAARTRDLKERFEQWNYDNNVCDMAEYNDSIPEYDEIDESQTETTKSIRAKFETLPHSGRIQNSKQPKVSRFLD
ncbi:hypothetical protein Bhyg_12925 [Pseudolycoriella hygida]|uniref:Uncharacterized protein n=1 Tax=Pseudolycoriella hygida TaxID=35572 RepID=A0A9Q0MY74_9DIPT|nr:hypothetical protein Bhyg_12925 [Pseudolycoriella hygida]